MTLSCKDMKRARPYAWTLTIVSTLAAGLFVARAQTPVPSALFQNSTITGTTNTINATRVPVTTLSGATDYFDVKLLFNTDGNGHLTIAAGYPQISPSAMLLVSSFRAGTYVEASTILNGKAIVVVSGPGIASGGATQWSLNAGSGADACTTPISATWYDGPIATSPYAARLKTAGVTSTAWSYGIGGGSGCSSSVVGILGPAWYAGSLIGVSQTGNTITIASFSRGGGSDYSVPQDEIVLTFHQ